MRVRVAAVFVAILAALAGAAFVAMRGPDPDAVPAADEVARRILSPYCPGLLLAECPTRQSAELRTRVAERVEAGWTNRMIDGWLVSDFGEGILGRPREPVAWAAPFAALLAGGGVVAYALRRSTRADEASSETPLPAADLERLRADLDRFSRGTTE